MPTHFIQLDRGDAGHRLDRVLQRHLAHLPGISRVKVQQWIDAGDVLVNGRLATRAGRRLSGRDEVRVEVREVRPRVRPQPEAIPLDVLYEDEDLLVVNKPAGVVAHPSYRHPSGTLVNALLAHTPTPHLVHRLDKQTSGVILVAKHTPAHAAVQRAMRRNDVRKEYLAVVVGRPTPRRGAIDIALDRDPWDRRRVTVRDRGGVPAVTKYERLVVSPPVALVGCQLVTGRMHQIRVHLSARKWPIVGDPTYGPRTFPGFDDPKAEASVRAFPRQALHAWRIELRHPTTGRELAIEAPIPEDLQRLMMDTGLQLRSVSPLFEF
jgi:23S rRNA pseudouridine1911/1915/1917 synthase